MPIITTVDFSKDADEVAEHEAVLAEMYTSEAKGESLPYDAMAQRMLRSVGVTTSKGVNIMAKGMVRLVDDYATDNGFYFDIAGNVYKR